MIEFLLFALLGLKVFVPLSERATTVVLVVFVVLMALLLVGGVATDWPMIHGWRLSR